MQHEKARASSAAYLGHQRPLLILKLPAESLGQKSGQYDGNVFGEVYVEPDIARLVLRPEPGPDEREEYDLDGVVHRVLIVGLALSTALMLVGIGFELARGMALPEAGLGPGHVFPRLAALRPSGFLTLGLLVLIATPILRVVGSITAFLYERDWRFAGVAALVLLIMVASIVLGKG